VKVVAGARDVNATIAAANRADVDRVASGGVEDFRRWLERRAGSGAVVARAGQPAAV
jgi:hypothetical protein